MEVRATLRFLRQSPKKVRLVVGLVRGMDVAEAEAQLRFAVKKAARPVLKLLRSAVANAENNFKLDPKTLYIKRIFVDEGPTLKRWRPRAFGRASMIRKRTSHITIILGEKGKEGDGEKKNEERKKAADSGIRENKTSLEEKEKPKKEEKGQKKESQDPGAKTAKGEKEEQARGEVEVKEKKNKEDVSDEKKGDS